MQTPNRFLSARHFAVVVLASAVAIPVWAQQAQPSAADSQSMPSSAAQQPSPTFEHPMSQPREGFWGRVNPFASKKWVKRQTDPINDRLTELDDVNARNARDIKDVDARAQAGILKAQTQADAANQTANSANQEALNANNTAQQASGHVDHVNQTVNGLDQYQQASDMEIKFRGGSPVLSSDAKAQLDQLAANLTGRQGYIRAALAYRVRNGWLNRSSATLWQNIRFLSIACIMWLWAMPRSLPRATKPSRSRRG